MNKALQESLQQKMGIIILESLMMNEMVIAVNTPDLITYDVTGKPIVQKGKAEASFGRPLPGIAVKTNGQDLYVKIPSLEEKSLWVNLGAYSLSNDGFITYR